MDLWHSGGCGQEAAEALLEQRCEAGVEEGFAFQSPQSQIRLRAP
jgi:hypothetical protein